MSINTLRAHVPYASIYLPTLRFRHIPYVLYQQTSCIRLLLVDDTLIVMPFSHLGPFLTTRESLVDLASFWQVFFSSLEIASPNSKWQIFFSINLPTKNYVRKYPT